jgi:hypothetical protein
MSARPPHLTRFLLVASRSGPCATAFLIPSVTKVVSPSSAAHSCARLTGCFPGDFDGRDAVVVGPFARYAGNWSSAIPPRPAAVIAARPPGSPSQPRLRRANRGLNVVRPRAHALRALHVDPRHGTGVDCTYPARASTRNPNLQPDPRNRQASPEAPRQPSVGPRQPGAVGCPTSQSRPGARFRDCSRPVSPDLSPNPPCASRRNGLSTVAAVRLLLSGSRDWGSWCRGSGTG